MVRNSEAESPSTTMLSQVDGCSCVSNMNYLDALH
jgi:hypothetical protein